MLRFLLYLQHITKHYCIFNSIPKMLIIAFEILHKHTQNLLIYTKMYWLQLHIIKVYNAQSSHLNDKVKIPSPNLSIMFPLTFIFLSLTHVLYLFLLICSSTPYIHVFSRAQVVSLIDHFPPLASLCVLGMEILVVSRNSVCGEEKEKETHRHT